MCSHVVLSVELLVAHLAWVWVTLQVSGDIVSVKVAGVGVGIVTDFAAVTVLWWSLIRAETSNADWGGILG